MAKTGAAVCACPHLKEPWRGRERESIKLRRTPSSSHTADCSQASLHFFFFFFFFSLLSLHHYSIRAGGHYVCKSCPEHWQPADGTGT